MLIPYIREINADLTIYTDGSADGGTTKGGAAAVITRGDPEDLEVLSTIKILGRSQTSSYEEEVQAMETALSWIRDHADPASHVLICTDSQSLCTALLGGGDDLAAIHDIVHEIEARVTIQWVPGHSNLPGNELADQAAKEATTIEGDSPPISYSCACTAIKKVIKDNDTEHARTQAIYAKRSKERDKAIKIRSDQVLLARLRSGHHEALRAYKHRINPDIEETCPACFEEGITNEKMTLEHWLCNCAAGAEWRMRKFGTHSGSLEWLATEPETVITYARATLVAPDAPQGPAHS